MFEKKVSRRRFQRKGEEVTGGRSNLRNEKNNYSLHYIVSVVTKLRGMRLAEHIA